VLEEIFLPVDRKALTRSNGVRLQWHIPGFMPPWEEADLLIFGIRTRSRDGEDPFVCRELNRLEWGRTEVRAVHLGILPVDTSGEQSRNWLKNIKHYIRENNPRAKILIYADRVPSAFMLEGWLDEDGRTVLFSPGSHLTPEHVWAVLGRKTGQGHLHIAGIQIYHTEKDFNRLLTFGEVDIWRLSDLKKEADLMETLMRDAGTVLCGMDMLAFGVTANVSHPVAGFDIYDWVGMFYHFGMSPTASDMWVWEKAPGDYPEKDAGALAMGIWHIADGMKNKTEDFPFIDRNRLQKVEIMADGHNIELYLNPDTRHWWVKLPKVGASYWMPVTQKAVETMRKGFLPFHILKHFV